jgi:hypothetical protein
MSEIQAVIKDVHDAAEHLTDELCLNSRPHRDAMIALAKCVGELEQCAFEAKYLPSRGTR